MRIDETRPFVGLALVYGLPVYLDMSSGVGISEVLGRMSGFLDGFLRWKRIDPAVDKADVRQEAYAAAIEGMYSYRHDCETQLSTFLHRHVLNRMIDFRRRARPSFRADSTELAAPRRIGPEEKIDLGREMDNLGERWGNIMRRILVEGEHIGDVAKDESMSPWGLTRALNKRLASTKRRLAR